MERIPNDYPIQRLNIGRAEVFIRELNGEYEEYRRVQELILPKIRDVKNDMEQEKRVLMILAWKWISIYRDRRSFQEIIQEIDDFIKNGFILPEIEAQMLQMNVDLIIDEACRFYDYVREILNQDPRHLSDKYKILELNINVNKYFLSDVIQRNQYIFETQSTNLDRLTEQLNDIESRLRELQRDINLHIELTE